MASERDWFIRVSKKLLSTDGKDLETMKDLYEKETGFQITVVDDDSAKKLVIDTTKPIKNE